MEIESILVLNLAPVVIVTPYGRIEPSSSHCPYSSIHSKSSNIIRASCFLSFTHVKKSLSPAVPVVEYHVYVDMESQMTNPNVALLGFT
ncbi:unnamed protein product [Caenorhabditis brenneri]